MKDERQCTATAKGTGQRCRRAAVPGGTVCRLHGGNAPRSQAAALRLERPAAQAEWERAYGSLAADGDRQVNPAVVVLAEIRWTSAHVEWLRAKVQALAPEDLVWGVTKSTVKRAPTGPDGRPMGEPQAEMTKEARPNLWLTLYAQERDRLVHQAATAAKIGIEERLVQLQQEHGTLLADVMRRVIGDPELGLSGDQQDKARTVAARHLRVLAGGAS